MARPTLDEFRDHVRSTAGTPSDPGRDSLEDYLNAAIELVERRCGSLEDGTVEVRVRESNPRSPYLPLPLTRVDEVVELLNPAGDTAVVDEARSNLEAGLLYAAAPRPGTWTVRVRRTRMAAATGPKLAVLIIAAHLLDARRQQYTPDAGFAEQMIVPAGYAIPRRAAELMADWLVPGFG